MLTAYDVRLGINDWSLESKEARTKSIFGSKTRFTKFTSPSKKKIIGYCGS